MESNYKQSLFWQTAYAFYPPLLRVLERLRIHTEIQPFLFGHLHPDKDLKALRRHLKRYGYEDAILAWKDPGEIMSMRRLDGPDFQYHLRLFANGELRGHYEPSSEGNPVGHVFMTTFETGWKEFGPLLKGFLVPLRKKKPAKRKAKRPGWRA